MTPRKSREHFAASISNDSVFDWGGSLSGTELDCKLSTGASTLTSDERTSDRENASRYDPSTMYRIKDIADLVDDSSGSDSEDDVVIGHSTRTGAISVDIEGGRNGGNNDRKRTKYNWARLKGSALFHRQTLAIMSLVALIFAASLAIGFAIINSDQSKTHNHDNTAQLATGSEGSSVEQKRLEMAERVVIACSEHSLDADISECQQLCHKSMCCFESGEYSCADDEEKDCAVYAGCEALVEGIPLDAVEEGEE